MAAGVLLAVVQGRQDTDRDAAVVAVAVEKGEVTLDVATTGTVRPATTRALGFAVTGTVRDVAVRAGTRVRAGQTLATVDDREAAGDVNDAEASLGDARARLDAAEDAAARVTASATACATTGPRAPGAQVAAVGCPTRGYPDTGGDAILTAEQAVNRAARAVAQARAALDGTVLKAPIAGTVVAVAGSVGDRVTGGQTFVTLADTYAMQVRAEFPEADAGALRAGQSATVTLGGHDDALNATVVQVDPVGAADGALVRYGALLSFATPPGDLLVGQSAQVRVRVGQATGVLRVPSTAVHDISGGSGTVLVHGGTTSARRTVTVGLRGDRYTQVTGGLTAGEQVVRSW
ncbi:hemolysin secretion protein D [Actinoplanes teichomyceticus]|nr:hemolysin secretion protein D [Actinoplanes teichomyceticus]